MEVKNYCTEMELQLTVWKAKLFDVLRKNDTLSVAEKAKVATQMNDLHILVEEISKRIENLKNECPADWSPIKKEIDQKNTDLQKKYAAMEIYLGAIP